MPAEDDLQPADPSAVQAGDDGADASGPEAVKRRFREALDKKHAHGGRDVSAGGGPAKVHDAHGPASTQRTFRRKSGG